MPSKSAYKITRKQWVGIAISLIGIGLLGYSMHAKNEQAQAKTFSENVSNFFKNNPIVEFFGGKAQQEIASYDTPILIMMLTGIALIVVGAAVVYIYRNRS